MMNAEIMGFRDLIARGEWKLVADELAVRPVDQVVARLEAVSPVERARLFSLLPPSRWARVFAALPPAKQNRDLVKTLARARR